MKKAQRVRSTPRISVNKLGEFLTTSSPVRRRAIVRGQKAPSDAIVPRYRKAIAPIERFLRSGGDDKATIADAIRRLRSATAKTDWVASDNENTALALERFLELADLLPFDGVRYIRRSDPGPLVFSGTSVSVHPEFVLRSDRRGKKCIGALKIHFVKGDDSALTHGGQQYVATVCHQWLTKHVAERFTPASALCLSLDLFRNSIVEAPKSMARRLNDIEAACAEIALAWPVV